jgi:hypothetical protein
MPGTSTTRSAPASARPGAIVDELGLALNLPGSLTGISAEMLAKKN